MINSKMKFLFPAIALSLLMTSFMAAGQEPWGPEQLMAPADLASMIKQNKDLPLIISVGPGALIKGSVDIGPGQDKENMQKLRALLAKQDKNRQVVIYCGCCPFKNCPNIRPAFGLLNEMEFSSPRLLNLAHNIKMDWLDKKYPVQDLK